MLPFWRMTTVPDAGVDLGTAGAGAEVCGWVTAAGVVGETAGVGPSRIVFVPTGSGGTGAVVPRMMFCGPPLS